MLSAVEARRLPAASLTPAEVERVSTILEQVDKAVRANMRRSGCAMELAETDSAVIAEVTLRLKALGWLPQWQPMMQESPVRGASPRHVGYRMNLVPSEAAFAEAALLPH